MRDQGGGGLELATILWVAVSALLALIAAYEFIAGHHHSATVWLLVVLLLTNCATLA
jgi:hypothetical protein